MTRWDLRTFAYAICACLVCGLAVFVVSALADEGGVAFVARVLRVLPALPLAGYVGTALVVQRAQRRGELAAFARSGVRPLRATLGAVLGAQMFAALGLTLAWSQAPLAAFFPAPPAAARFEWTGQGFATDGLTVNLDGHLERSPMVDLVSTWMPPPHAALALLLTLAAAGLAAPLLATNNRKGPWFLVFLITIVGSLLVFQAAAAYRVAALYAPLPWGIVLAGSVIQSVRDNRLGGRN